VNSLLIVLQGLTAFESILYNQQLASVSHAPPELSNLQMYAISCASFAQVDPLLKHPETEQSQANCEWVKDGMDDLSDDYSSVFEVN